MRTLRPAGSRPVCTLSPESGRWTPRNGTGFRAWPCHLSGIRRRSKGRLLMSRGLSLRRAACFLGCAAASVVARPALASARSPGPAGTPSWTVYHDDLAGSGVAARVGSVDTAARAWTSPVLDAPMYGGPLVPGGARHDARQGAPRH